jgi:hypothetical protein
MSFLSVITAVAAAAAILTADPGDAGSADATIAATNRILASDPEMARLNVRTYELGARIAYKDLLVQELVAGRATLAQVSDEFLRLNEEEPAELHVLRHRYPGSGDEEKSANNVLHFVHLVGLPAAEEGRVRARLDREFADRFGHPPAANF